MMMDPRRLSHAAGTVLLLLAALLGAAGLAHAQRTMWSATLDARQVSSAAVGCRNLSSQFRCSDSQVLTTDDFSYKGIDYAVHQIVWTSSSTLGDKFHLEFSVSASSTDAFVNDLSLHIGNDLTVPFSDGTFVDYNVGDMDVEGITWPRTEAIVSAMPAGATVTLRITAGPPGVPTALSATANGSARIDLWWTAPADRGDSDVTGYRIERSPDGGSPWTELVADTASTATFYSDRELVGGTTRHYRVSAINSSGAGDPSESAGATTPGESGGNATGAPVISGSARVGQELTASTSRIDDDNGLGDFSYQWIRVDGLEETNIESATSTTYTLVTADRGKQVRVKVSFTDGAGQVEALTSDVFPASGRVQAQSASGPLYVSSEVDGLGTEVSVSLQATAGSGLDTTDVPPASAFRVEVDGVPGTVTGVRASSTAVTLTVSPTVMRHQMVLVSYTDPTTGDDDNALQDTSGNDAPSFANRQATNNSTVVDTTPPAPMERRGAPGYSGIAGEHQATTQLVQIGFDEPLDADNPPPASVFAIKLDGAESEVTITSVSVTADTVQLVIPRTIQEGQEVTVSYADPTEDDDDNAIQDRSGNDAASFDDLAVRNAADTTAPAVSEATLNGRSLVITFDETLAAAPSLANSAFRVKITPRGSNERKVKLSGTPAVRGASVTLTLSAGVERKDTKVKVTYIRPTTGSDNRLADTAGNEVADFTDRSVTIETLSPNRVVRQSPNRAPVFPSETATRLIPENTAPNVNLGQPFSATDDDGDTLSYALIGPDAGNFNIDRSNGQVRTRAPLNHETQASHSVEVKANDGKGGTDTIAVTITVVDVDEKAPRPPAPFVAALSRTSLRVWWKWKGRDGGPEITGYNLRYRPGTTGDWTAWPHSGLEREARITGLTAGTSYQVQLQAVNEEIPSDWSPSRTASTHRLRNQVPVFSDDATARSIRENPGAAANVGAPVTATDPDGGTLTYSLSGPDATSFTIEPSSGQIRTLAGVTYDYETKTSYSVTVTARDDRGGRDSIAVTIQLTNVDETQAALPAPGRAALRWTGSSRPELTWNTVTGATGYQFRVGRHPRAVDLVQVACRTLRHDAWFAIPGGGGTRRYTLPRAVDSPEWSGVDYDCNLSDGPWELVAQVRAVANGVPGASSPRLLMPERTPRVVGVRMASQPPGPGGRYPLGAAVAVEVVFDEPVRVEGGVPTVDLRIGGQARRASYAGVSGPGRGCRDLVMRCRDNAGRYVRFEYRVVTGDEGADGTVEVPAGSIRLNGATVRDGTLSAQVRGTVRDASVSWTRSWRFTGHLMDGAGPRLTGLTWSIVAGRALVYLRYNEPLDTDTRLSASDFDMDYSVSQLRTCAACPVEHASRSGTTVTLRLANVDRGEPLPAQVRVRNPLPSETVEVRYKGMRSFATTTRRFGLYDLAGNPAPAFSFRAARFVEVEPEMRMRGSGTDEGEGATVNFLITLSHASSRTVRVDYETLDGTASAGQDYDAVSGTLRFAPGEIRKLLTVPVRDDSVNEGRETLIMRLSNVSGATLVNAEASGYIDNADPMPKAWLARFGRTASVQAVEAVGERLTPRGRKNQLSIGGRRVDRMLERVWRSGSGAKGRKEGVEKLPGDGGRAAGGRWRYGSVRGGVGGAEGVEGPAARKRVLGLLGLPSLKNLRRDSSFFYSPASEGGADSGRSWSVWGQTALTRLRGVDGDFVVKGDVATAMVGADTGRERWLTGLMVAYSEGEGDYSDRGVPGRGGEVASTLVSVYPYARFEVSERTSVWGMVGYGLGEVSLEPERGGSKLEADVKTTMGAVGGRGVLSVRHTDAGSFELAARTDALLTEAASEATRGMASASGDTSRVRLLLEGTGSVPLGARQRLKPRLEAGLRYDGGDAETGAGFEVGGGLVWQAGGLTVKAAARALAAHEDSEYEEWGLSGSVQYRPRRDGRGPRLRVGSAWGAAGSRARALWSLPDASALPQEEAEAARRFQAELGYGLQGWSGRGLWSPYVGVESAGGGAGTVRTGVKFSSGPKTRVGLELSRRQRARGEPDYAARLGASLRW